MTSSANYKTNKNIHVSCFVYKERNQYMKLRALSSYDGDKDTRFGDCILIYDNSTLIVYDCGHERHANEVKNFLQKNYSINPEFATCVKVFHKIFLYFARFSLLFF